MSLILEALKKSEAERRIGEAPGLLSPGPTVMVSRRGTRVWLWTLFVVALLLALVAAWWIGHAGGDAPAAPVVATSPPAPTPGNQTAAPASPDAPPVPARPRARLAQPPDPPAARQSAHPAPEPSSTAAAKAPAGDREPAPITAAPPRARGERESLPVAAGELPVAAPAIAEKPPTRQPGATGAARPAAKPPATAAAGSERLPTLRQLDSTTRAELPPLRISMHVFTDEPGGRFVIIDNHRYAEGASVAGGLHIAEIRRDGVVMEFRGRRFLLDRPG